MKLKGEKIYLRPVQKSDLPTFVRWLADSDITRFTQGRPFTLKEEIEWFKKFQSDPNKMVFSIYLKANNKLIGNCVIHQKTKTEDQYDGKTTLGIMIGEKDEWGKGYGTDTISTLLFYCKKTLQISSVFLTVDLLNEPAQKCYKKCGFQVLEKRYNPERPNNDEEYVMKIDLTNN